MSEYWKSTPKYWCKHCKTYVRDTKLEKTNHEATPKHQGNLKRFLRDLHRGHEKEEKDKERAKAEVARLNGMGSGSGVAPPSMTASSGLGRGPTPSAPKPPAYATPAQRKQQIEQLAELGVVLPDEFRPEMAMAGEWQVMSERVLEPEGEKKPEALAMGVRKREAEDEEPEELEAKKRRWGSAYRSHPTGEEDGDLDALLSSVVRKGKGPALKTETTQDDKTEVKEELSASELPIKAMSDLPANDNIVKSEIKSEPSEGDLSLSSMIPPSDAGVKQEGEEVAPGVVFKKRKAKNIRQK